MVSKAAERSSRQRQVTCWRPMALIRWSWMEMSRVSVEWNFWYADWSGLRSWIRTRWSVKRDWTTRSTILDMVERLEIGLLLERFSLSREGFLRRGVIIDSFSWGGNSPAARLRLTMRVMMGARTQEQCLRSDVGRAWRPHCLLGRSIISLVFHL